MKKLFTLMALLIMPIAFSSSASAQGLTAKQYFPPTPLAPSLAQTTNTYSLGAGSITHEVTFGVNGDWTFDRYIPSFDPAMGTLVSIDVELWLGLYRQIELEVTSPTGRASFMSSWDYGFHYRLPYLDEVGAAGDGWWRCDITWPGLIPGNEPITQWSEPVSIITDLAGGSGQRTSMTFPEKKTDYTYTDTATLNYFTSATATVRKVDVTASHRSELWLVFVTGTTYIPNGWAYNPGRMVTTYNFQ